MENPDVLLCREIKNGNKTVFEKVFHRYYSSLCSYALTLTGNPQDAEEMVQEVFFRLWQQKEKLDIQISLKAYLFRAVHNGSLNYLKHEKIKLNYAHELLAKNNDTNPGFNSPLEREELSRLIMKAIEKLPPERQKIFRMIRLEERKYKEVAEILGISVKTVENQMGKAMQFLREELKDYIFLLPLIGIRFFENIF